MRNEVEHHTSLEATLREIMEMMARQEVVSQLVAREHTSKQDLVQSLVARQHAVELETKLTACTRRMPRSCWRACRRSSATRPGT